MLYLGWRRTVLHWKYGVPTRSWPCYSSMRQSQKWHPDKCSAGGSVDSDQAKRKFQALQAAYSVLSDDKKRFLYDTGLYNASEEEEEGSYGMADFMGELAALMTKTQSQSTEADSFEDLKELFMKINDPNKCTPVYVQKQGFTDIGAHPSSKRSWTEENFTFAEMHTSGRDFDNFQTNDVCMGSKNDSSGTSQQGKKRSCRNKKFEKC